ncbi:MAG TPA: hypothetical protein VE944_16575 [Nostoc sp.]|nr:hypothetical protein [Nostoc sp.]HYX15947.1 hypothetical protein [Nostoc sp.]
MLEGLSLEAPLPIQKPYTHRSSRLAVIFGEYYDEKIKGYQEIAVVMRVG